MATDSLTGKLSFFNYFFGGHQGGFRLVNSMYDGSDYVNKTSNACSALALMDVANYKPCQKSMSVSMMPGDVHFCFTDLVIQTAQFHRNIDQPQQKDKRLNVVSTRDNVVGKVKEVLLKGAFNLFERFNTDKTGESVKQVIMPIRAQLDAQYQRSFDNALQPAINACARKHASMSPDPLDSMMDSTTKVEFNRLFLDTFSETLFRNLKDLTQTVSHTYVGSQNEAEQLVRNVYGNWASLNADEKKFYWSNIGLFYLNDRSADLFGLSNAESNQRNFNNTLWQRMSCEQLDSGLLNKYAGSQNIFTGTNLRLNLMKSTNDNVLFAENLPSIPRGTRLWYTTENGILNSTSGKSLLEIYNDVYYGSMSAPSNPDKTDLHECLDMPKYMEALIKGCSHPDQQMNGLNITTHVDGTLDDYDFLNVANDMVYGYSWKYDTNKQQFFRLNGNQRIYYDQAIKNASNTCYATYLGGDRGSNAAGCKRVVDCILTSDGDSLGRCMDVIKDTSLWNVASNDIKNVDPEKIRKILRKFNVRAYNIVADNGDNIKQPQTYNEWLSSLPADKKQLYSNNKPMLSYLRGLIEICRGNPVVLNSGLRGSSIAGFESTPSIVKNLGLKRGLKYGANDNKQKFAILAQQLNVPSSYVNRVLSPTPILNGINNTSIYPPIHMSGGGGNYSVVSPMLPTFNTRSTIDYSIDKFQNGGVVKTVYVSLFDNIRKALKDIGAKMSDEDELKLTNTLTQVAKHELEMAKMATMLNTFVKIAHITGVPPIYRFNTQKLRTVSLRDLDSSNLNDFVGHHIQNLNTQINKGNNVMNVNHTNLFRTLVKFVNELNVLYGGIPVNVVKNTRESNQLVDIDA